MSSFFNRILFSVLTTVTVLVLLFGYHTSRSGPVDGLAAGTVPAITGGSGSSGSSGPSGDPAAGSASPPDDPTTAQPDTGSGSGSGSGGGSGSGSGSGSGANGAPVTVTGPSTPTEWGPVQVQVTVDGSTITDVTVVEYPTGNRKDIEINNYALPILIQQTIDSQSAQVDMISGATVTSRGYATSLQAALDEALA